MARLRRLGESGMTVTELTVTASLLVVILAASYALYEFGNQATDRTMSRMESLDYARVIDTIAREIRQATPPADGESPILTCQARDIAFYLDVDNDGALERVHYWAQGKLVYRGVTEPSVPVAVPPSYAGQPEQTKVIVASVKGGWNGALFTYYDNAEPANTLNPSGKDRVSAVYIELQTQGKEPHATAPEVTKVSTYVKIRSVYNWLD